MVRFLFNGSIAPLMNGVGFIKADIIDCVQACKEWMETANIVEVTELKGTLENVVKKLLPFRYMSKRIFIPTNSEWVAFTDNLLMQAELGKLNVIGKKIKAEVVHIIARPCDFGKTVNGWGGGRFLIFNKNNEYIRGLELSLQERWEMHFHGDPLPFEKLEPYKEKFAKNRFTPDMLEEYAKAIGIEFFNEDFYMPAGNTAYMLEQKRELYENEEETYLEEARKRLKYE